MKIRLKHKTINRKQDRNYEREEKESKMNQTKKKNNKNQIRTNNKRKTTWKTRKYIKNRQKQ